MSTYKPRRQGRKDALEGKPPFAHRSAWNQSEYDEGYVAGVRERQAREGEAVTEESGRTHYADDATLQYIADLERRLVLALDEAEPVAIYHGHAKGVGHALTLRVERIDPGAKLYTAPQPCPQCADWTRRSESCESKRDAELYRWLRNARGLTLRSSTGTWTRPDGSTYNETYYLVADGIQYGPAETLDDTIRAAMAHEAESI